MHCGHCGRLLTGERHKKKRHEYIYYRCGRRQVGSYQCHAPAPTEAEVTKRLVRELGHIEIDARLPPVGTPGHRLVGGQDRSNPVSMAKKAKRELAKAERHLATLTDLAVANGITKEEYKVRRMNQLKRIEHLREALAEPLERLEAWKAAKLHACLPCAA